MGAPVTATTVVMRTTTDTAGDGGGGGGYGDDQGGHIDGCPCKDNEGDDDEEDDFCAHSNSNSMRKCSAVEGSVVGMQIRSAKKRSPLCLLK